MVKRILKEGITQFLVILKLKILILECSINKDNKMNFKERK